MSRVAAIILAAGASTRLGEPKQLVTLAGERLLERAIRIAREAGCAPVIAVLGSDAQRIADECTLTGAQVIVNETWSEGMAASIRAGVRAIRYLADAAIVMTCDQPAVTSEHLKQLMAIGLADTVASHYDGRAGVPACFPATCFDDLLSLRGDAGARHLLASAQTINLPQGGLDIDTPSALDAARKRYK